ncbi:MAG: bifunctional ornithine acetyltransferase/N-acetylglutamate synthase [Spirochaetales bacterium]|nr:bifunctional ornithine acetyltransferase/N-acetylglutamate synthase [Spirochaetales bacterium]
MEIFHTREEYRAALEARAALPAGFKAGVASLSFFPEELGRAKEYPMNLALILLDRPTPSFHALFTRNLFCGAPVVIGRERLKEKYARGILVNNKISNVAAPGGVEAQESVLAALAEALGERQERFFPASTGIIGWKLPAAEMRAKVGELSGNLQSTSLLPVAEAMMTTDAFPKVRSARCGEGVIVAAAKGAGMIEPNLATMLVFVLTDVQVSRSSLKKCLTRAAAATLNRISIDSDQSTSDMVIALSSNIKPAVGEEAFARGLEEVLGLLSGDIVRNGEGVTHVMQVTIEGAPSVELAESAGKAMVNSPLVKTAVFGNDPNVGRLVSSLGDFFGNRGFALPRSLLSVSIGGIEIFAGDRFLLDEEKEKRLFAYLDECSFSLAGRFPPHDRSVNITVGLNVGTKRATVLGADLSYDYVKENASYRS